MKKLYTTALAAMVAVCASAAGLTTARTLDKVTDLKANTVEFTADRNAAIISKLNAAPARKAPKHAEAAEDGTQDYIMISLDNEQENLETSSCYITPTDNDTVFTLHNFIMPGTDDITCYITEKIVEDGGGQSYIFKSLTIPAATRLYKSGINIYKLYLIGLNSDGTVGYDPEADMEFIELEDGYYIFAWDGGGIAWLNSQNRGNWIFEPELITPNGEYSTEVAQWDEEGTEILGYEAEQGKLFAEPLEQEGINGLMVANFDGYSYCVVMLVDTNAKTATAVEQMLTIATDGQNTFEVYASAEWQTITPLVGNITIADGTTTIEFEEMYAVVPNMGLLSAEQNLSMTLDYDLFAQYSGVEAVSADTNAPVEYYNLQGVRVAEPATGVYIRRQGNTASKVYLK